MGWYLYLAVALLACGLAGSFVGRYRASCAGMTGMMVGMTLGMMGGLIIGYGAAAASNMIWGNLFGMLIGLALGAYNGRPAGLMGMMDGGMGGLMGGSMGAMLAVMVRFSPEGMVLTAVLLVAVYALAIFALTRLVRDAAVPAETPAFPDYYAALGISRPAAQDDIYRAYFVALGNAGHDASARLENALTVLIDPAKRQIYDRMLDVQTTPLAAAPEEATAEARKPLGWRAIATALIVAALMAEIALFTATRGRNDQQFDAQRLDRLAQLVPLDAAGRQTIDLTIDGDTMSYDQQEIVVRRGQPVRLNLHVAGKDPDCGRVLMIPELGLEVSGVALPGQVMAMDFTPDKSGTFRINCPMLMMRSAYLIVTDGVTFP